MTAATRPRNYDYRLSKRVIFGLLILLVFYLAALLAPYVAPRDSSLAPLFTNLPDANIPPGAAGHLFGTDYLGRDVLKEAIWGARTSLGVGIISALLAAAFGSLWGTLSAFAGGIIDSIMMRIVDGMLAIPSIILLLALDSLITTPSITSALPPWLLGVLHITSYSYGSLPLVTVVIAISATTWLEAARIARGKILIVKSEEYIAAATAIGTGFWRMIVKHLLPNAGAVILIEATLLVSDAILMESGLSYLGLGLGPSTPSWGTMLTSGQLSLVQGNWWAVLIPGVLITMTVIAVTLVGEGWLEVTGLHKNR
ncbi:MAG TPA: ABC transporter permease [Planktothrix sp.]|jgi:peptide/nickel transport system permease protein